MTTFGIMDRAGVMSSQPMILRGWREMINAAGTEKNSGVNPSKKIQSSGKGRPLSRLATIALTEPKIAKMLTMAQITQASRTVPRRFRMALASWVQYTTRSSRDRYGETANNNQGPYYAPPFFPLRDSSGAITWSTRP